MISRDEKWKFVSDLSERGFFDKKSVRIEAKKKLIYRYLFLFSNKDFLPFIALAGSTFALFIAPPIINCRWTALLMALS